MFSFHRLVTLFLVFALGPVAMGAPLNLTILHTNDHHGHVLGDKNGLGGMAARATLIDGIRAEVKAAGGQVLLLDAGDVNSGSAVSDLLRAEPDFKMMKQLAYDAMAIGNHEFDVSFETLSQQRDWAGFPFLSANIELPADTKLKAPWTPYLSKTIGDKNVVVLGLTTRETPLVTHPDKVRGYHFASPVESAKKVLSSLEHKADLVIALTHMGYYGSEGAPLDVESDVDVANSVKGVDLIIGGHSHTALHKPAVHNKVPIFQAGEHGKFLGRIDLRLEDGAVEFLGSSLIPVQVKEGGLQESLAVKESLKPILEKAAAVLTTPIGDLQAPGLDGDRKIVRARACAMGALVAESFRQTLLVDVAIVNGGSIRASFKSGAVTNGDLLSVLPFPDSLVVVILSGRELEEYLINVIENFRLEGNGSYPHFSGVTARVAQGKVANLLVGGKPIDPDKQYHLGMPEFMAKGGDKYPILSERKGYTKTGNTAAQALTEYWKREKNIDPAKWDKAASETLKE